MMCSRENQDFSRLARQLVHGPACSPPDRELCHRLQRTSESGKVESGSAHTLSGATLCLRNRYSRKLSYVYRRIRVFAYAPCKNIVARYHPDFSRASVQESARRTRGPCLRRAVQQVSYQRSNRDPILIQSFGRSIAPSWGWLNARAGGVLPILGRRPAPLFTSAHNRIPSRSRPRCQAMPLCASASREQSITGELSWSSASRGHRCQTGKS